VTVGWGWPQSQPVARAIRRLNIDSTRQCQLGRRIAPPVIATFELAHAFIGVIKKKRAALTTTVKAAHFVYGQGDLELHPHAAHSAHAAGHWRLILFRNVGNHGFGREHESRD
jgi:hypothetical protein